MLDTLECSVNWDNFMDVYKSVRTYCKSRPNTMCMTHMSHFYHRRKPLLHLPGENGQH